MLRMILCVIIHMTVAIGISYNKKIKFIRSIWVNGTVYIYCHRLCTMWWARARVCVVFIVLCYTYERLQVTSYDENTHFRASMNTWKQLKSASRVSCCCCCYCYCCKWPNRSWVINQFYGRCVSVCVCACMVLVLLILEVEWCLKRAIFIR